MKKSNRKNDVATREKLIIKQGGLDPITGDKLIQVNSNGKKIELSCSMDCAHINAVSENGPRYISGIDTETEENKIMVRSDTHRNIDKDNPEEYPEEKLKVYKKEILNKTNDEKVYKYMKSCSCKYIYKKK